MTNLKKLKFKKKLFGGIDELDALKKIKAINQEYQILLENQKLEYLKIIQKKNEVIKDLESKFNSK